MDQLDDDYRSLANYEPQTAVTSVLETFASLRKLFASCNFDNMAWL